MRFPHAPRLPVAGNATTSTRIARPVLLALLTAACLLGGPLYADCPLPPFFDADPISLSCATPTDPCRCSQAIIWDPEPRAQWYEVQRTSPAGTVHQVGRRPARECVGVDENDTCISWEERPWWLPAWDCAHGPASVGCIFPRYRVVYQYAVRACNASGCSSWSPTYQYARDVWLWCDPRNTPACVTAAP